MGDSNKRSLITTSPEEMQRTPVKMSALDRSTAAAPTKVKSDRPLTIADLETLLRRHTLTLTEEITKSESRIKDEIGLRVGKLEDKVKVLEQQIIELEKKNYIPPVETTGLIEMRLERMERENRRNNISITGLNVKKEEVNEIITECLKGTSANNIQLRDIRVFHTNRGPKIIGRASSLEDKMRLFKEKQQLNYNGTPFFLDDDLTQEEQKIQFRIREIARSMRSKDQTTKIAYRKITINDKIYSLNRETNAFQDEEGNALEEKENFNSSKCLQPARITQNSRVEYTRS